MHQQKTPPPQHEFIRKHKRKLSPKHKHDHLYSFKPAKPQLKKEEQTLVLGQKQKQPIKKDDEIVLDLKHQLSFLKEEMAKIVHSKRQSAPNDMQNSKLKLLDYYFPKQQQKTQTQSEHREHHSDINSAFIRQMQQEKSIERDLKKVKSKDKLKFSKIKKSEKISPNTNSKNMPHSKQANGLGEQANFRYPVQQQDGKKSTESSTVDQQIKKLSQKNKLSLEFKLKSLVWEQQNIDANTPKLKVAKHDSQSKQGLKVSGASPLKQQKSPIYQLKITRLKKKLQQQQQQLMALSQSLKQKNNLLQMTQTELHQTQHTLSTCQQRLQNTQKQLQHKQQQLQHKQQKLQEKQQQFSNLSRRINQCTLINQQLSMANKQQSQQLKKNLTQTSQLQQTTTILQQKLKNRQYQIIKLQKITLNHEQRQKSIVQNHNRIVEDLKAQVQLHKLTYQTQISQKNHIIDQINRKIQSLQNHKQIDTLKLNFLQPVKSCPKQQHSSAPSPRNHSSNKQKELLSVIKMHQKSIQNYQKDLHFLETQCKALHQFKIIAKKHELLIKDLNDLLLKEQLAGMNMKYEKKLLSAFSNNSSPKQTPQLTAKRPPGRTSQQFSHSKVTDK